MLRPIGFSSVILLCLMLLSCSRYSNVLSNAEAYENAGLHQKAFEEYKSAFEKKSDVQAFIGMNNAARSILVQKHSEIVKKSMSGDYSAALDLVDEYRSLDNQYSSLGLELTTTRNADEIEAQIKNEWADVCVAKAQELLFKGDFEAADRWIRELQFAKRDDPRISGLQTLSAVVEKYRAGEGYIKLKLNKQAYKEFNDVVRLDASFADALHKRDSLMNILSYNLACVVIDNRSVSNGVEIHTANTIQERLLNDLENYIHLIERQELDLILEEQRHNMGAAFDETTAIEAGQLAGARYIISGRFIEYTVNVDRSPAQKKLAFKGKSAGFSKRVDYDEYQAEWNIEVVFNWKLLDAQTGRVYRSGSVPFSQNGEAKYAEYRGDHRELYPGETMLGRFPTPWDRVHKEQEARREFMKMFEENFELIPEQNKIEDDIFSTIAREVSEGIQDFIPLN